ncbi:unnamed protein product [Brassicogethes aeneus]|uniref:guanylate kinase n=1 Tax=Brassicogethes aeneus TaxID=1431903 RepID=A0A9P0FAU9_BRAAE|nr:unnamed protein product [Brassicogethes aeneus]
MMSTLKTIRPLMFCGPSGSGKSTLLKKLLDDFPDKFGFSVSHTTRKPRPGEVHGKHYFFTEMDAMKEAISDGLFIENACYGGNLYGTSRKAVESVAKDGKVCILDIEVQGVKQIKKTDLNPWSVFVKPPSLEHLKQRLVARNTETEETLARRLKAAEEEMEYGTSEGNFDVTIVNDNLDQAYENLKDFVVKKVLSEL